MYNLNGFDLVYAISQHALNLQLKLLFAQQLLPTQFLARNDDEGWAIDATIGVPSVSIVKGNARARQLSVSFPFASGTMKYLVASIHDGNPVATPKEINVSGYVLRVLVSLDLARIAARDIAEHRAIPPAVKAQLDRFDANMYDIDHVFLNFEDGELIRNSVELDPPSGAANPDLANPSVLAQVGALAHAALGQIRQSNNPYILVYQANAKAGALRASQNGADLIPTGSTFSLFEDPDSPELSSLNILCQTGGKPVPNGADAGQFDHNWITSADLQGAYVIAAPIVAAAVAAPISAIFGFGPSDYSDEGGYIIAQRKVSENSSVQVGVAYLDDSHNDWQYQIYQFFEEDLYLKNIKTVSLQGFLEARNFVDFSIDEKYNVEIAFRRTDLVRVVKDVHFEDPVWELQFMEAKKTLPKKINADIDAAAAGNFATFSDSAETAPHVVANGLDTASLNAHLVLGAGGKFLFKDAHIVLNGHLAITATIEN